MVNTGLQGKVALITGANHGIGAATATALAAEGVSVLINYLRMPPMGSYRPGEELDRYDTLRAKTADEVLQAIRAQGGRAEAIEDDLSDPATIPFLFDRAEAVLGPVDILVNNADYCLQDTFLPQSLGEHKAPDGYTTSPFSVEMHDRRFAINSRAIALLINEFAWRRLAHGIHWWRIITISSDGAPGFAGEVSYGASKYAAESYARAAAFELGKFGITANIVSPGPVQTGWVTPAAEEQIKRETPLGRVGQPMDIADVIVFLASEQARWVSGQMISVSGGRRIF